MDSPACPGCQQRDRRIAALEQRLAELEDQLRQLMGRNASNSSTPPSANPPGAPKPTVKEATGRKAGAQPGHAPQNQVRLPAERVDHVERLVPTHCTGCGKRLAARAGPHDPPPLWHQVVELPPVLVHVTEYQGHARTCGHCGAVTRASIPAAIRAHRYGPRLTATLSVLTGTFQVSKRDAEGMVEGILGVPIAVGSISAAERETTAALAAAYAEAQQACQDAPFNHVDETSWKLGKKLLWLWTAVSGACTLFLIHRGRSAAALSALFTKAFAGVMITDRWVVYNRLAVRLRQLCWAHLIRDFQALFETRGPGHELGEALLCFAEDIFTFWYRVRDGTLQRSTFRQYVSEQRPWLRAVLAEGAACTCAKTAALCRNLLKWEPALWTFARVEGVEPTNNAAERALRKAVLWRRRSFGCKSDAGCRFVERILTVAKTLQQHQRPVLPYVEQSIAALRAGQPAPRLLPTS